MSSFGIISWDFVLEGVCPRGVLSDSAFVLGCFVLEGFCPTNLCSITFEKHGRIEIGLQFATVQRSHFYTKVYFLLCYVSLEQYKAVMTY